MAPLVPVITRDTPVSLSEFLLTRTLLIRTDLYRYPQTQGTWLVRVTITRGPLTGGSTAP